MALLESKIGSAKVYHSGATVSRVIELEPAEGRAPRDVEITGLPLALLDPTVRVRVETIEPENAELLATDVHVGLHAAARAETQEDPLQEKLKEVEREILKRSKALDQLEHEMALLRGMGVPDRPEAKRGEPPPASPMAARVALERFTDESLSQRTKEARELREEVDGFEEAAAELRDRIANASDAKQVKPHELSKSVVIRLDQGEAPVRRARLIVDYFIPGARWVPAYQCRLSRDCRSAELQLRALICQRSGEDWEGVDLTLSTAAPLSWTELPELSSIRIGKVQPQPLAKRGFRPPPIGSAELFSDYDRDRSHAATLVPEPPRWYPPSLFAVQPPSPLLGRGGQVSRSRRHAPAEAGQAVEEQTMALDEPVYDSESTAESLPMAEPAGAPPRMAPPPMPQAAPRPMAAAMSAAPPMPPQSPGTRAAKRKRAEAAPSVPEEARPALEVLAFSQLRLPRPNEVDQRSKLVPVDRETAYVEHLRDRTNAAIELNVMDVVRQAQREASDISSRPLPQGTFDVRFNSGHFDFSYRADAKVDVPSDGTFHSVALSTREAPSTVRYVVVPREDTNAYRMATLTNPIAAPLMPGPVEVHVGGEYVLTTILPSVAPGGRFLLGLGVEQAIKVARNTRFDESRSGEKVVAMTELTHTIEVELVNHLAREVDCEVRERIPQPADGAEVVVEELEVEPPWEIYTQAERNHELWGGRRWRVTIGAGGAETLRAGYVVKIYANNELVGGNRREA